MISASPIIYDHETYRKFVEEAFGKPLQDGEQRIVLLPGYDFRGTKDDQYGQHTPTLMFSERRGNRAVDIRIYSGWAMDGNVHQPICTGIYFHGDHKTREYSYDTKDCNLTGGACFGQAGSALYGDQILARIMAEGTPAAWKEIDIAFKEWTDELRIHRCRVVFH